MDLLPHLHKIRHHSVTILGQRNVVGSNVDTSRGKHVIVVLMSSALLSHSDSGVSGDIKGLKDSSSLEH